MTAALKLAYALRAGALVHVSEVASGRQADCLCPVCQHPLIARKGAQRQHHFAHDPGSTCNLESAIHWVAKQLLFDRIQAALSRQEEIPIQWQCQRCPDRHEGNLLRRARAAQLEQSLGPVRPDILLLRQAGTPAVAVEIVVSHDPEAVALTHYASASIPVVVYRLQSESDVEALRGPAALAVETTACQRRKCPQCREPLYDRTVHIVADDCSRCGRSMPVPYTRVGETTYVPAAFTKLEMEAAQKKGCHFGASLRKTRDTTDLTNECPYCGAPAGSDLLNVSWHLADFDHPIHRGKFCIACHRGFDV